MTARLKRERVDAMSLGMRSEKRRRRVLDKAARAGADRLRMSFPFWATTKKSSTYFLLYIIKEIKVGIKE